MWNYISKKMKWIRLRREWYRKNSHNHCAIQKPFDITKVTIGKETYGMINPYFYHNPDEKLVIGSYCSIGEDTRFVFSEHDYSKFSTFPFQEFVLGEKEKNPTKGPIILEDDVWIGMNCMILSGVVIHQGAVIGAGSVVAKDIPPYAIYAGGKIVKYRFDEETIEKLLKIDFNKLGKEDVAENRNLIYQTLNRHFFDSELYFKLCR